MRMRIIVTAATVFLAVGVAAGSLFLSGVFTSQALQNLSFVNLPIDGTVHRDLTSASQIPAAAPGPQTAAFGASYLGTQTFAVSPDTPAKVPPDDTSYSAPTGGVLALVQTQVLANN